MGRRPADEPLRVYLNNRRVGAVSREASGAISFSYHDDWLGWEHALPASLSLPLSETPYRGAGVECSGDICQYTPKGLSNGDRRCSERSRHGPFAQS